LGGLGIWIFLLDRFKGSGGKFTLITGMTSCEGFVTAGGGVTRSGTGALVFKLCFDSITLLLL
jgi:hypothetical protein